MRYIGGKHRIAKQLAQAILPYREGRRFLEPFCGGLSATVALQPDVASDASEPLIKLIEAVRSGWEPPAKIDFYTWKENRRQNTPIGALVSHGLGFGGDWNGYYARDNRRDTTGDATRALLRKVEATRNVQFLHRSYEQVDVQYGDLIYCDPPYAGTTNGYATGPFDSEAFWDWAKWAGDTCGALVFISEFNGPDWVEVHAEFPSRTNLHKRDASQQATVEKLFRVGDH